MGNGYNTYFWLDSWVGDGVILSEKFPRLFRSETNKNVIVGEMHERSVSEWAWRWRWRWVRIPRGSGKGELM